MKEWDLASIEVEPHHPEVLSSSEEARAIAINLPADESLHDHEVHERSYLFVVAGELEVRSGEDQVNAGAGHLFEFDHGERHEIRARSDSRLLLLLAPWPGPGHPGTRG